MLGQVPRHPNPLSHKAHSYFEALGGAVLGTSADDLLQDLLQRQPNLGVQGLTGFGVQWIMNA